MTFESTRKLSVCEKPNLEDLDKIRLEEVFDNACLFINELIGTYFWERLKFRDRKKLHKLPGFEVMELLTNSEVGLYGFHLYFSNGSYASFIRKENSIECPNLSPNRDGTVNYSVGSLDELTHEWRIKDKRLYEVGLPGRYNKSGEWKPLVYPPPGKPERLKKIA